MKRYFIPAEKALEIYLDDITLLDESLIIKSESLSGDVSLEAIVSLVNFNKRDVAGYLKYCQSRGEELLYEIDQYEVADLKEIGLNITEYTQDENGLYHDEATLKELRTINLIEYGALKSGALNNIQTNNLATVVLTPKGDSFAFSELKSIIGTNEPIKKRRQSLDELKLGADFYFYTEDPETLDDLRTWITEIKEEKRNEFYINKRNYFVVKPLSIEKLDTLSLEHIRIYNQLVENGYPVFQNKSTKELSFDDVSDVNAYDEKLLVKRENIELLLGDGFDKMLFKDLIEVYTQSKDELVKNNLEDVLDIPRTYLKKNMVSDVKTDALKMHVFYEYDPLTLIPDELKKAGFAEFEHVNYTDEGYPIWRKSAKIVQRQSKKEFAESLELTGNKYFIEINGLPNEREVVDALIDTGLLREFIVYDDHNLKQGSHITYYVSKPYQKNATKSR